ncbi:MAG: FkbM family methyltransferase [Acidimicrobiia bacterium]|nr:FkbM family methyltransferase [Acidimicrobiia bacterium]
MNERARQRLHQIERAVRPSATAHLRQVDALTTGLESLRRSIDDQAAEIRALRVELAALTGQAAPASLTSEVVDTRNARYDQLTGEVIDRVLADGANAIDVGAHVGDILVRILAVSPGGTHVGFEPLPHLADTLRRRFPGVEIHDVALSDAEGEVEFHHVVDSPAFSGIRQRRLESDDALVQKISVRMARLDDMVPVDRPVAFLKIDVEGAELGVLRGGKELIRRHRPVTVFEFGLGASDIYGTTPADIHGFFAERGMEVSLLDGWLAGRPPLGLAELTRQYDVCENFYFLAHPR